MQKSTSESNWSLSPSLFPEDKKTASLAFQIDDPPFTLYTEHQASDQLLNKTLM